jgi:adenylate cyclase
VAGLHAQLAYLHLEEFRQGYNKLPGNPLDRALVSAQRAVAVAPASARSHQALLAVHFARRESDSAWRAAEEALALNPYDTEIQADVGARHVQSGNYARGLAMLTEALQLNPAPPTWAVTFRALALYLLGRIEQSGPLASALKGSEYAPAMMALIMVARQYRDEALGKESLAAMRRAHPGIVEDPAGYLRRLNFDDQTLERVARDFSVSRDWAAGLR